ncbi:hypothetical protein EVG20_g1410 [Dentipellis fragilis]|uniref:RRM domain-containing protein n=1 Tax=Dentipellis fragilis TaxID=205917 RepID=A0A4Y9ZCW0_9AGAM|nr:hypothetical protein EVG20_g1410 [Dentipellis fragilis]
MPTRSLWISNLESSVTSEQIIHGFAPYGAIESLRLLPEKGMSSTVSGVNIVHQQSMSSNASSNALPGAARKTTANAGLNDLDAQLQLTQTHALWIGSMPSTTMPVTMLSIFSLYGAIELARVLKPHTQELPFHRLQASG